MLKVNVFNFKFHIISQFTLVLQLKIGSAECKYE